jgi:Domain of unknown function (DUF1818)
MDRVLKSGENWRIGWNPQAPVYQGLVGSDDWAIELTAAELDDFCRLLIQLNETMANLASELMEEEKIAIEVESDLIWLEAQGYPQAYELRLIIQQNRCCEGNWPPSVVKELVQASQNLKNF